MWASRGLANVMQCRGSVAETIRRHSVGRREVRNDFMIARLLRLRNIHNLHDTRHDRSHKAASPYSIVNN
jgi:hypothetical protein